MEEVEKELIEATGFNPKKEYPDRQDYLAALARATDGLPVDDFDELSNEATNWFNAAAQALNDQSEIPEFDGTLPDVDDTDDAAESDAEPEPEEESEAEEKVEERPDPKPKSKSKKAADKSPKTPAKTAKEDKPKPRGQKKRSESYKELPHPEVKDISKDASQIEFDRFGLAIGTQNAAAIAMLTKGCRMGDVTESIGGTYYNVLRRLVKDGHHLEKQGNGVLLLTHKDDLAKGKGKK